MPLGYETIEHLQSDIDYLNGQATPLATRRDKLKEAHDASYNRLVVKHKDADDEEAQLRNLYWQREAITIELLDIESQLIQKYRLLVNFDTYEPILGIDTSPIVFEDDEEEEEEEEETTPSK